MKEEKQRDSNRGDENRIKRMNRTKGQKVKPGEEWRWEKHWINTRGEGTIGQQISEADKSQGQRQTSSKQAFSWMCWVIIPGVPAAGLEQVANSVVLGIPGDQRCSLGGEIIGGDALQARDFQSETHRAQSRRRQTLQHAKTVLKWRYEEIILKRNERSCCSRNCCLLHLDSEPKQ